MNTVYEIDFGGNVMCKMVVVDNAIDVIAAMDGYGNPISLSDIVITNISVI